MKKLPSHFCVLPWSHAVINSNGNISPCSRFYEDQILGNMKSDTFNEAWNGPKMEAFRSEVLSEKAPAALSLSVKPAAKVPPEKLITLGKRGDLHARRLAAETILDPEVTKKLFETIGPRYKERNGGYTRLLKVGARAGDAAPIVIMELVDRES